MTLHITRGRSAHDTLEYSAEMLCKGLIDETGRIVSAEEAPEDIQMVLLSERERRYASELREKAEHVDLSLDQEFQMEFGEAMMFPTEEIDYCVDE